MVLICDKYFEIIRKNFFMKLLFYFIIWGFILFALLTDYIWVSCPVAIKSSKKEINAYHQKRAENTSPSFYFSGCGTTGMIFKMSWERRKKS